MQRLFYYLFATLFFFTPLILWPYTSEIFEFNKMIFIYLMTTVITATWAIRCITEKKFVFRRTLLDWPLIFYLIVLLVSTMFSIDIHTSIFGYYSRFNGGFLSILCYCLLYWAFVSNMNRKSALNTLYWVLGTTVIVSIYGILQHFGIDKNIWVQDVQNRVFSSLGQPNWLAAYLVALLPVITNYQLPITNKFKIFNYLISALLFTTLLFTKSRSGLLGFIVADLIYWGFIFVKYKKEYFKQFIVYHLMFVVLFLFIGSPISNLQSPISSSAPALETGGTESGSIRKIVWKGAVEIWKDSPILGTGPETFAYAYYAHRPVEHNLVSEWDFIYNKAHNEYLNLGATTGTLGLLSYLILITFSIAQITNYHRQAGYSLPITNKLSINKLANDKSLKNENWQMINVALTAGYVSILVTNFFGFSVVPTQLLFFLFPAIALSLKQESKRVEEYKSKKINLKIVVFVYSLALLLFYSIGKYWYTDILYAKRTLASLTRAIEISPNEPVYHLRLAEMYIDHKDPQKAIVHSQKAVELSPSNVNLKRALFSTYIRLSTDNSKYLVNAGGVLEDAIKSAPTDAKLFYNLGLTYVRLGQIDKAIETLQKTIELKPNYKEARLAYAILLVSKKENQKAKEQLEYILEFIDPNDQLVQQALKEIN